MKVQGFALQLGKTFDTYKILDYCRWFDFEGFRFCLLLHLMLFLTVFSKVVINLVKKSSQFVTSSLFSLESFEL